MNESQIESPTNTPYEKLLQIAKFVGLAVMATVLYGCPGKAPDEALQQSSQSGYLEQVRRDCKDQAMEAVNVGGGMLDLSMSARLDDAEVLEQQCLEDRGVVVSP